MQRGQRREFPDRTFVASAPVGSGDHWGFQVIDGRCHDEVWFRFHEAGDLELDADDFLELSTGFATGWLPGQLSKTGRKLAQELGKRRSGDGLAAVFASDLARAAETAEIAFAGTGIPIRQDPRLRECNYGTFNGMPAR
jgi:hypothetical protein